MSAGTAIRTNPNILMAQSYQMDGGGQFANFLTPSPAGLVDTFRISNSNAQCSVKFVLNGGIDFVRVDPASMKAYRYLPYVQNGITYITLNGGARLILSGPINGCHISVAQNPGGPVTVMHTNWNNIPTTTPAGIIANAQYKTNLANAVRMSLPGQPPITNRLTYRPFPPIANYYQSLGFLVGTKAAHGGAWSFYVYSIGGAVSPRLLQF